MIGPLKTKAAGRSSNLANGNEEDCKVQRSEVDFEGNKNIMHAAMTCEYFSHYH